jgi:hypothetical protein
MQYIAEDRERQARLEEKREERQDKRDAMLLQVFNDKHDALKARQDAVDELNKNTMRVVATGPHIDGGWSYLEFISDMNKKYCKRLGMHIDGMVIPAGLGVESSRIFERDHSWCELTLGQLETIINRSGVPRENLRVKNKQEGEKHLPIIKSPYYEVLEKHVIAWFEEAHTARSTATQFTVVGGRNNVCYVDWDPESLYWHYTDLGFTGDARKERIRVAYTKCPAHVPLSAALWYFDPDAPKVPKVKKSKKAPTV